MPTPGPRYLPCTSGSLACAGMIVGVNYRAPIDAYLLYQKGAPAPTLPSAAPAWLGSKLLASLVESYWRRKKARL